MIKVSYQSISGLGETIDFPDGKFTVEQDTTLVIKGTSDVEVGGVILSRIIYWKGRFLARVVKW